MFGCVYFGELGFGQVWAYGGDAGIVVGGDRGHHKVVGGDNADGPGTVRGRNYSGGLVIGGNADGPGIVRGRDYSGGLVIGGDEGAGG